MSLLLFLSCDHNVTDSSETGEIPLSFSLQPAYDQGFNVTQVRVTVTKDDFITSLYLTIEDSTASGTITNLEPGIYQITVEVYDGDDLIAIGSGSAEVIAGETTSVEIVLVFVPLTGNLEIYVNWGNLLPELPQRILFIGNSITYFNGGVDLHTMNLANSIDSTLDVFCDNVTWGGWTLEQHYSNALTIQTIEEGNWDMVVLQEMTSRPVDDPELFYQYAILLDSVITNAGAETAFFFSWPFRGVFDEMIEYQAAAYNYIGELLDAPVIPVARAWQKSREENPGLELFMQDGNHPNVFGTYLTCCTFYCFFWYDNPYGATYVNDPSITESDRLFLQNIAWETYEIYSP